MRQLLAKYNEAAAEQNASGKAEKLPLWSPEVLKAVGVATGEETKSGGT